MASPSTQRHEEKEQNSISASNDHLQAEEKISAPVIAANGATARPLLSLTSSNKEQAEEPIKLPKVTWGEFSKRIRWKNVKNRKWLLSSFLLFKVLLPMTDLITDTLTGITLLLRGHKMWGLCTMTLPFVPFIVGLLMHLVRVIRKQQGGMRGCYKLFPFAQPVMWVFRIFVLVHSLVWSIMLLVTFSIGCAWW